MVLVATTVKQRIDSINSYIKGKSNLIGLLIYRSENPDGIFDSTYVATLQAQVFALLQKNIQAYRWLATNQAFSVPVAFDDAEMIVEIPNILEVENGL